MKTTSPHISPYHINDDIVHETTGLGRITQEPLYMDGWELQL